MLLLNAIYFKGAWDQKFNEKFTRKTPFKISADKSLKVDMMEQEAKFREKRDEKFGAHIIELPFNNGSVDMFFLVPLKYFQLAQLESKITAAKSEEVLELLDMEESEKYPITVLLPKFKLKTSLKLKPTLSKLGFANIFENGNFESMLDDPVKVDDAFQKAFIEVLQFLEKLILRKTSWG